MTDGRGSDRRLPLVVGLVGAAVTIVAAKWHLPGLGNDATSYVAIADRLARHGELGYFLEHRLTLWPPGWPATLAFFEWAFGIRPQITALTINALTMIVIAFEAWWLLRRLVRDDRIVAVGTIVATLGPATVSQSYMVQTETTFIALVLGSFIALIRFSDSRRWSWFGLAVLLQWFAFLDRYVGIVAIGAGALWLLFESGTQTAMARVRNAIGFGLASAVVPGAWLLRNISVTGDIGSAFGPRDTPTATYARNLVDATTSVGQFIHGLSRYEPFTGILRLVSLALLALCGVIALALLARWIVDRRAASAPDPVSNASLARAAIGGPAGLLAIYAFAHWVYMIYSASTIAFDPVNTRYLAPMFIPALIASLTLVDRGRAGWGPLTPRLLSIGVGTLLVIQVGGGLVRVSASYWNDAASGYDAPQWQRALASPVLDQLPDDCEHVYSNFPEATYLAHIEAQRSPRITKFASSDHLTELRDATRAVDRGEKSCLIWISPRVLATPTYQHPLSDIRAEVDLVPVARDRDVAVYVMAPRA